MGRQFELGRARQELRRKERELKNAQEVSARWLADLTAKFSEAQELGLAAKPEQELSREQMIERLEEVVARTDLTLSVSTSTISDALRELSGLEVEEREVSREPTTLRHRLSEMNRMRVGVDHYQDALALQRGRLQLSSWLVSHTGDEADCPMCGSHTDSAKRKLAVLSSAYRKSRLRGRHRQGGTGGLRPRTAARDDGGWTGDGAAALGSESQAGLVGAFGRSASAAVCRAASRAVRRKPRIRP